MQHRWVAAEAVSRTKLKSVEQRQDHSHTVVDSLRSRVKDAMQVGAKCWSKQDSERRSSSQDLSSIHYSACTRMDGNERYTSAGLYCM